MHVIQKWGNKLGVLQRDVDGKRVENIVSDFMPYFYVLEEVEVPKIKEVIKVESGFKSLFGEKLKKITMDSPSSVKWFRNQFAKTFEADIKYTSRYLIDHPEILNPNEKIRYVVIDIEVESLEEFPDPNKGDHEMISVSCYDNFLDKYVVLVYRKDLEEKKIRKSREYLGKTHSYTVHYFNSERKMILFLGEFIKFTSPDLVLGWNTVAFDYNYLIHRISNLGLDKRILSPVHGEVNISTMFKNIRTDKSGSDRVFLNIEGTTVLDCLEMYRRFQNYLSPWTLFGIESYSLDNIANKELGEGKAESKNPSLLWTEDLDKLEFYNYYDVFLTKGIIEKVKLIDLLNTLRIELCCSWDAVIYAGQYLDFYTVREANKLGFVLPTKEKREPIPFEGAYTKEPRPGLLKNIIELDMKSMYPSLIQDFAISPENIADDGEIIVDDVKFKNKDGILQHLVKDIYDKRMKLKKELREVEKEYGVRSGKWEYINMKQTMYKIIMNAMYGVFGYSKFRLFDVRVAKSITYTGRQVIMHVNDFVKTLNFNSEYSDTDSVFTKVSDNFKEDDLEEVAKDLVVKINNELRTFAKDKFNVDASHLEIELDKIYKSLLFVEAKKKYMGIVINSGGNKCYVLHLAGFEMKRRTTPKFAKELLKEIYTFILEGKSKDEVEDFIRNNMNKIVEKDFNDFGITIRIGKNLDEYTKSNPQHIRGVRYSEKNFKKFFARMDFIKIIFIKRVASGYPHTDVISLGENDKLPEGFIVDYERTLKRILEMSLEDIFKILKWDIVFNYNFVKGQKELNEWMK